jgi:enoyl-CoA hydratase
MTMAFETIEYATADQRATLTLNRPDKLNAINAQMVAELNQALDLAEANDNVRSIVLTGNGRAFSAGFDLDGGADGTDPVALRNELRDDFDIIMRFWSSPKTTIAAVHGYCLGSAMEMAVACDLTVAAEGSRFGAPEVKFGSGIVAMVLPWFIGPKRAKEMLLTGAIDISAQTALSYGLVNRVVVGDELMTEVCTLADQIAGNDLMAVRLTKQAINRGYDIAGMRQALLQALELDVIVESMDSEESAVDGRS